MCGHDVYTLIFAQTFRRLLGSKAGFAESRNACLWLPSWQCQQTPQPALGGCNDQLLQGNSVFRRHAAHLYPSKVCKLFEGLTISTVAAEKLVLNAFQEAEATQAK